jgi:hypothetical protein
VGAVHYWPTGAAHCYENPSDRFQTILCVDSPHFIESDEVVVQGEPARVAEETLRGRTSPVMRGT